MKSLASINGQITTLEEAFVPAKDRGFLFGDNIFETLVAFSGKILNVPKHLQRLRTSAENMGIHIPWSDEQLAFELETLAESTKNKKSFLRLVVTRGEGFGLSVSEELTPNKYIFCGPANKDPETILKNGLRLKIRQSTSTDRGPSAKTGNYLSSIVAIQKAKNFGFDDILWVNRDDEITKASTANIFFIGRFGDEVEIVTPSLYSGLLKGITRDTVMSLLEKARIRVEERVVYAEEIAKFDEAFVCSTVRGLVPIRQINSHMLHTSREKSIFNHIKSLYLTWAEVELGYRVDWNSGDKVGS